MWNLIERRYPLTSPELERLRQELQAVVGIILAAMVIHVRHQ